jgi:biopolymer transport protein ExbB
MDTRSLDLSNLQAQLAAHKEENAYLSNLLDEYVRNFETRIHVTELQRYRDGLERAHAAAEASEQHPAEFYRAQAAVVEMSLDRLLDVLGGTTFDGSAIAENGQVKAVTFALVGPVALFRVKDGSEAGMAEQRLGSLEPNMVRLDNPELTAAADGVVRNGSGSMPFDPSLGNAQKIEATQEGLREHMLKGGPVMIPILLLAAAALIVALGKWIQVSLVRAPSSKKLEAIFRDVRGQETDSAYARAQALRGPTGEMLAAGLERITEPKVLVEEVMFEKMLETRLRLQSFLPFVAVAAAAAPLLGLLGTVTGIINTFKLITVFGTGDAKTLSSGISEALITTEFGLIVAIPSLLLHAFLSRKARRIVDGMEKAAVSMLNRIPSVAAPAAVTAEGVAQRVIELLALREKRAEVRGDTMAWAAAVQPGSVEGAGH